MPLLGRSQICVYISWNEIKNLKNKLHLVLLVGIELNKITEISLIYKLSEKLLIQN